MIREVEQATPAASVGAKIIRRSLAVAALGALPLLLYVALGPSDGNPIGLGLLAFLAINAGAAGLVVGVITLVVERTGVGRGTRG